MEAAKTPILATLLSGVLPGASATAFRQALGADKPGGGSLEQLDEAVRIFGEASISFSDSQRALEWLSSPSEVFGGKSPVSIMDSEEGRAAVRAALVRIEHGLFY